MSNQKYNIEHKNYAMKVMEWFYSIETDFDPDKHEVGESNYSIVVILQYPSSSVAQAMHTKPTIKVYYPKHVEKSFHDYDETGKYMYAAKEDYYINKLMFLETGPYKVYIKRTGTQVDKLNTCNI